MRAAQDKRARRQLARERRAMGRRENYCTACGCHHDTYTMGCKRCWDRAFYRLRRDPGRPDAAWLRSWLPVAGSVGRQQNARAMRGRKRAL